MAANGGLHYITTSLFGGSITAALPREFFDASTIREVPDNQELRLSQTSSTSVIIDILERAAPPVHPCTTDEEALRYHYEDIVAQGYGRIENDVDESGQVWTEGRVPFKELPQNIGLSLLATRQPRAILKDQTSLLEPDKAFTALLVTLLRLPQVRTDVVITINIPHEGRPESGGDANAIAMGEGRYGARINEGVEIRQRICDSFRVDDWNLFIQED